MISCTQYTLYNRQKNWGLKINDNVYNLPVNLWLIDTKLEYWTNTSFLNLIIPIIFFTNTLYFFKITFITACSLVRIVMYHEFLTNRHTDLLGDSNVKLSFTYRHPSFPPLLTSCKNMNEEIIEISYYHLKDGCITEQWLEGRPPLSGKCKMWHKTL